MIGRAIVAGALTASVAVQGASSFYVDNRRSANGSGTAASPWKALSDISWTSVSNAVASGATTVYLSSRATWSSGSDFTPLAWGTVANRLYVVGDEVYNTNATGTANWQSETGTGRAKLSAGGSFIIGRTGFSYFTIKGLYIDHPTWSAVQFFVADPTTNIHDIAVVNCVIDSPTNSLGIAGSYMTTGCSNFTVASCTFSNTPGESIYLGRYDYLANTMTGVVIESNLVVNCGTSTSPEGQGDIDVKPSCYGAIVRYNRHLRTAANLGGSACGVVVATGGCQVYGNQFYRMAKDSGNGWGVGIFVHSDGDGAGNGHAVAGCLIYNNLVWGCDKSGIKLTATSSTGGADISGVRLWNNTVWGNGTYGVDAGSSGGRSITITDMSGNVVGGNTNYDVSLSGAVTLSAANENLYYRTDGSNSWTFNGALNWAGWKALGYDAAGVQANPLFVSSASGNYRLAPGSPAIGAAVVSGFFTTDITGATRTVPWDIGAYESFLDVTAPRNVAILTAP